MIAELNTKPRVVILRYGMKGFSYCRDRPLRAAIILAVLFRFAVFFGTMIWPIPNENLMLVSPLLGQGYFDFGFYVESLNQYRSETTWSILQKFIIFYQRPFEAQFTHIVAGPVFPLLIGIFDYTDGNTLPLAICFLVFNCLWWIMWLDWAANKGLGLTWLCIMAVLPNPVWFMLVVSPDFVFAALVGAFYLLYMRRQQSVRTTVLWSLLLVGIVLTRPNGYSVLLFVLLDNVWRHYRLGEGNKWLIALIGLSVILAGLYIYPYFVTEMSKTMIKHFFFDVPTTDYWSGLFPTLPKWVDVGISLTALGGAKFLYFVGLRPSYGLAFDGLVILRALPGLVLLPGLFYGLIFAGMRNRIFLLIFLFPIFLGPSQDRYNLPVYPLLFVFGVLAITEVWRKSFRMR